MIEVTMTTTYDDREVKTITTHKSWDSAFARIAQEARATMRSVQRHGRVFWSSRSFDVREVEPAAAPRAEQEAEA